MKATRRTCTILATMFLCCGLAHAQISSQLDAEGRVVISGDNVELLGIDLISAAGNLVPIAPGDLTAPATPFAFTLANAASQVTFGSLSSPVILNGDLVLDVKYDGTSSEFAVDMAGTWGGPVGDGDILFVPEPSATLMAAFAVLGLFGWRRR